VVQAPPAGRVPMGSSAQRILLDADRPVLAVEPGADGS
jgi:hypothetical protein